MQHLFKNFASTIIDIILNETGLPSPLPLDGNTTNSNAVKLLKSFLVNGKDLKPASFLTRSLYMLHFDRWLKLFKKENFLVLKKENLKNTPEVFNKIEQFLNLKHVEVEQSKLDFEWNWPELTEIVQGKG